MGRAGPSDRPTALVCPIRRLPADRFVVAPTGEVLACEDCAAERGLAGAPLTLAEWEASDAARAALAAYGLLDATLARPAQVEWRLPQTRTWEVRAAGVSYVLERYPPWLGLDAIHYHHSVVRHLAGRHLPVALPVLGPDGADAAWADGAYWALYPPLEGEPAPPQQWLFRATVAASRLAVLHRALEDCQPEGSPHPEWDALTLPRLDALLARWPPLPGAPDDLVARARDWLAQRYFGNGYDRRPRMVVHGDFGIASLLWVDGQPSGYVGFERAHPDTALCDFGLGLWTQHPPPLRARISAYTRIRPLGPPEREALPEAMLLGVLLAIEGHLALSREAGETARLVDALAHLLGNLDNLRRAAMQ